MNTQKSIFTQILEDPSQQQLMVYRDEHVAVFPSLHQREANRGHMLVIPVPHVTAIYDLDEQLGGKVIHQVSRIASAVKLAFSADGVAVKQHNDRAGGQDVFHLHFHVVPCFADDGFHRGNHRWPKGLVEVPLEDRLAQVEAVKAALQQL